MAVTGETRGVRVALALVLGVTRVAHAQEPAPYPAPAPTTHWGAVPPAPAPPAPVYAPYAPAPVYAPYAPAPYAPAPPHGYAPPAPPPDTEGDGASRASWCAGAGVGFADSTISTLQLGSVGTVAAFPSYRAALERRLGNKTWLTLNGAFSYQRTQQPVIGSGLGALGALGDSPRTELELRMFRVAGVLGLRHVVVHDVVDVSLFEAIEIARQATSGDDPRDGEGVSVQPGSSVNTLGFVGGFAIERRLIDALSLRLSVGVLSAATSRAEFARTLNGEKTLVAVSTQSIDVFLAPALYAFFFF